MTQLYFNNKTLPGSTGREKIFLAETPEGVFNDPQLQAGVAGWIAAHKNDPELSYGSFLCREALIETSTPASWRSNPEDEKLWERAPLAQMFAPVVEKNLTALLAKTLRMGVDNPEVNRKNFEQFIMEMHDDLMVIKETEDLVISHEEQDFVKETHALATAASPQLAAHLKSSSAYDRFYNSTSRANNANLIQRSEELMRLFGASSVFARITRHFAKLNACRSLEDYQALAGAPSCTGHPFVATAAYKNLLPSPPKITKATLATNRMFVVNYKFTQEKFDWKRIDEYFDVIKYIGCDDQVSYFAKNRKKLNVMEAGRA